MVLCPRTVVGRLLYNVNFEVSFSKLRKFQLNSSCSLWVVAILATIPGMSCTGKDFIRTSYQLYSLCYKSILASDCENEIMKKYSFKMTKYAKNELFVVPLLLFSSAA